MEPIMSLAASVIKKYLENLSKKKNNYDSWNDGKQRT